MGKRVSPLPFGFFWGTALLFSGAAEAAKIDLFLCEPRIQFAMNYEKQLAKLRPGDRVSLCDGKKDIVISRKLGEGNRAAVYAVAGDDYAIRFPLDEYLGDPGTKSGEKLLNQYRVPHVAVLESRGSFWTKVEKLAPGDFVSFKDFEKGFSAKRDAHLVERLREFAWRTAIFFDLGDLHEENLVFSHARDEWLMLDWAEDHVVWHFKREDPSRQMGHQPVKNLLEYTGSSVLRRVSEEIAAEVTAIRLELWEIGRAQKFSFPTWIEKKLESQRCKLTLRARAI